MTAFCIRDTKNNRMILADSGLVFKAIDRGVAERALEKLRHDGADVSCLEIVEVRL